MVKHSKFKNGKDKKSLPIALVPDLKFPPYPRNPVFNFLGRPKEEFDAYAGAFHRAAKTLADKMFSRAGIHDLDACPIIFLYRHAFELYLKSVVLRGSKLLRLSGKTHMDDRVFLNDHSLIKLLPVLKLIFETVKWEWDFEKEGFRTYEDFCKLVNRLEGITSKSFAFRYPVSKNGESYLPSGYGIDMRNFCESMDFALKLLDGAATGLEEIWDVMAEEAYLNQMEALQ